MKKILIALLAMIMLIMPISGAFAEDINDGEMPPTIEDILRDKQRMKELEASRAQDKNSLLSSRMTRSSIWEGYYRNLSVPTYEQETDYYCGPAVMKQTLQYINGSSLSQSTYASHMGTVSGTGTYVYKMTNELNDQQTTRTYTHKDVYSRTAMMDKIESSMRAGVPAILHIKGSTSLGWPYANGSGHYVNASGIEYLMIGNTIMDQVKVTDPWGPGLGDTWYHSQTVYDVVDNRANYVIY